MGVFNSLVIFSPLGLNPDSAIGHDPLRNSFYCHHAGK